MRHYLLWGQLHHSHIVGSIINININININIDIDIDIDIYIYINIDIDIDTDIHIKEGKQQQGETAVVARGYLHRAGEHPNGVERSTGEPVGPGQ